MKPFIGAQGIAMEVRTHLGFLLSLERERGGLGGGGGYLSPSPKSQRVLHCRKGVCVCLNTMLTLFTMNSTDEMSAAVLWKGKIMELFCCSFHF